MRALADKTGAVRDAWTCTWTCAWAAILMLAACSGGDKAGGAQTEGAQAEGTSPAAGLKVDKGIDVQKKVVRIGTLNDESGPAATIGKPYAVGKRILAQQVNAGGTGFLPEGWTVEMVEKDHGYNPQKSVQAYNQIKDDVLLIATSFGTPNTLPLRPMLKRDKVVALPASLASSMSEHEFTPPFAATYLTESMRAMDWVVAEVKEQGGKVEDIKAGIVYQQDDYGMDGLKGWKKAADHYGVKLVSEHTVTPGQRDFAAIVTGLKEAGATHVLLTVLPSASAPLLGTAAGLEYKPVWIGNSPTWVDRFFDAEVIPHEVFETFYLTAGLPYWEEDEPGMKAFMQAYEKYGKQDSEPDSYILQSYMQGRLALEIVKRAIESGDATRAGVLRATHTVKDLKLGDMGAPISLGSVPYETTPLSRVRKPDFSKTSWTVVAPFAPPAAGGPEKASL